MKTMKQLKPVRCPICNLALIPFGALKVSLGRSEKLGHIMDLSCTNARHIKLQVVQYNHKRGSVSFAPTTCLKLGHEEYSVAGKEEFLYELLAVYKEEYQRRHGRVTEQEMENSEKTFAERCYEV